MLAIDQPLMSLDGFEHFRIRSRRGIEQALNHQSICFGELNESLAFNDMFRLFERGVGDKLLQRTAANRRRLNHHRTNSE